MIKSIHSYLADNHRCHEPWAFSENDRVSILTVVRITDPPATPLGPRYDIRLEAVDWNTLAESIVKPTQTSLVFRLVSIQSSSNNRVVDLREDVFRDVHQIFGHELAAHLCEALVSGVGRTATSLAIDDNTVHFLSFHPSVTATWSLQDSCLNMIFISDGTKERSLQRLLAQAFVEEFMEQPGTPLMLCAIILGSEIDSALEGVKSQVRQVEVRTGHHSWKSRSEPAALGDLVGLTAKMSGCSTRLASCLRKHAMVNKIIEQYRSEADHDKRETKTINERWTALPSRKQLDAVCDVLLAQSSAQRMDLDFVKQRVSTQLEALYYLVAQNDALSAQEMAKDCRLLAVASRHDSSSMKCIAVVTMFFLPGTFVSSLLSIPLFDWAAETSSTMYRREYWKPVLVTFSAMTLPLMLLTFGVWASWRTLHFLRERKKSMLAKIYLETPAKDDEVELLSIKRRCVTGDT